MSWILRLWVFNFFGYFRLGYGLGSYQINWKFRKDILNTKMFFLVFMYWF